MGSWRKPRLGAEFLALHPPQERDWGERAVRGPRAPARNEGGNCKGKSETKKREKFFPARGHVPRQHRAKRGRREAAGREASRWRGGFRGRARSLQRSRGRAGGGPEVEPEGLVPRPVNPKECLGQQRGFPLEEGKLGGHVTQADLGSGPRASTCPCKSLLPFKPHFMQTVKWGWSYLPKWL